MIRSILIGWTMLACLFLYAVGLYLLIGTSGMPTIGVVSMLMAAGLSYVAYDTIRCGPGYLPRRTPARRKRSVTRRPAQPAAGRRPGVQVAVS